MINGVFGSIINTLPPLFLSCIDKFLLDPGSKGMFDLETNTFTGVNSFGAMLCVSSFSVIVLFWATLLLLLKLETKRSKKAMKIKNCMSESWLGNWCDSPSRAAEHLITEMIWCVLWFEYFSVLFSFLLDNFSFFLG